MRSRSSGSTASGTWVAGYTDSVFGYLPSVRVLREGGYEGGDAMLYFGRPGPFADTVEATVMNGVDRADGRHRRKKRHARDATWRPPRRSRGVAARSPALGPTGGPRTL